MTCRYCYCYEKDAKKKDKVMESDDDSGVVAPLPAEFDI